MSTAPALIVIAKAPVAGRSKTRLTPPCTPEQAARLAEAALTDTLETVAATPAARHVLALEGMPGGWLPDGFEVIPQRGDGLAERLAAAFHDVGEPAFLIGMDTPQVTPALLAAGQRAIEDRTTAAFGRAHDGGYWSIGLRDADPRAFDDVPMSTARTGRVQRERLDALGLTVTELPALLDVDTIADAHAVAAAAPGTRFAATLRALDLTEAQAA